MTSPQPPEQPVVEHEHAPPDPAAEEAAAALAVLLLLLLAAGAATVALGAAGVVGTAAQTVGAIVRGAAGVFGSSRAPDPEDLRDQAVRVLMRAGVSRAAARMALALWSGRPLPARTAAAGTVLGDQQTEAARYRALFIVNSARRIDRATQQAERDARAAGDDPAEARRRAAGEQTQREARYWQQHQSAEQKRQQGAAWLDAATSQWGPRLTWIAVLDRATTAECRVAHRHTFTTSGPGRPRIGLPGTGPHVHCRCIAAPESWATCPTGLSVNQALALASWPSHHHT